MERVGVFICGGCGIAAAIDLARLAKVATTEDSAPAAKGSMKPLRVQALRTHAFLCGKEGTELIRRDIEREGMDALVIAACSPRTKTEVFSAFSSEAVLGRVNLREHVTWCQASGGEDTQLMAEDYLRMGIAKALKMTPCTPPPEEVSRTILVVGGGTTGLTAAREAAVAGYEVVLVEKEARLGGYAAGLHRLLPRKPPYLEMEEPVTLRELIQGVEDNRRIRVFKGARVQSASGAPGRFEIVVAAGGGTETVRAGAIVAAPGFKRYDPARLGALGYGSYPNVVTHDNIEEMAGAGKIVRPSDGKPVRDVVFVQCAGSRDPNHLPYCSSVCCLTSLKQARYLREADSETRVFIIYKDIRTPGQFESYYRQVQQDEGVFLTKGEVESVQQDADRGLRVRVAKTLLGEDIEIRADLVVLATGMVPVTALEELNAAATPDQDANGMETLAREAKANPTADLRAGEVSPTGLPESPGKQAEHQVGKVAGNEEADLPPVEEADQGDKSGLHPDRLSQADSPAAQRNLVCSPAEQTRSQQADGQQPDLPADRIVRSGVLNLTYRQGPELPSLRYGFPDSHFVCFPYESRRTGIYPAGCVRQPMDGYLAMSDAAGAALKAIQCVEMVARGEAVHPRAGDRSYPELFLQRCTQCKRCTEECPFGMYDEDEKGTPKPNPTRCRRCGICMGSCPERIIGFQDFSVDIVSSMVKAIGVPEEDEQKPRVVCFICENDAYPCVDLAGIRRLRYSPFIRFIPLRCLGDINLVWIADALSKGIDGILLIGCKHGDDYQCHFVKGSELAEYRMGKIQETLDRLVLEADRIRVLQLGIDEYGLLPRLIGEFLERLAEVGPNPYKGW